MLKSLFLCPRLKDYLSKEGERKVAAEEKQKNKLEKLRYIFRIRIFPSRIQGLKDPGSGSVS
jgi:hypothetical protein